MPETQLAGMIDKENIQRRYKDTGTSILSCPDKSPFTAVEYMNNDIQDILFIRSFPKNITIPPSNRNVLESIIRKSGITVPCGRHNITFLFPGVGKFQKTPSQEIIHRINTGLITDIIDIGAGGALDHTLQRGDLVLSYEDIPSDTKTPIKVQRRLEIKDIVQKLADKYSSRFHEGKILTSSHAVTKREERSYLYSLTGCSVVQMEHCWFIRKIERLVSSVVFKNLFFTHIEIVSDEVPKNDSFSYRILELYYILKYCLFHNQNYLGNIKTDFLHLWLNEAVSGTEMETKASC